MSVVTLSPEVEAELQTYDPVPNKSFASDNPYLQVVWDSTSLGVLKECPWKYFLSIICGWESKAPKPALEFGIQYHAAMELFDKLLAEGASRNEALKQVVQCAGWKGNFVPEGDSSRTQQTLVRTIVWHIENYSSSKVSTVILSDGSPAVELSFKMPFFSANGYDFLLAGHIDRLVEYSNSLWFLDYKTTKLSLNPKYFAQYTPDNQMDLYTLASQVVFETPCAGGIVDAAQLGVNFTRFKRQEITRTPEQIDEWVEDTRLWISLAENFASIRQWPKNEKSCDKYGGCPFRESVCSKSPSVRETFLKTSFKRKVWDPSTSR